VSISRCRWCDDSHSPAASVNELKNMTVVILAGGLGTRLRSVVGDRPKVLASVQVDDRFERFAPESIDLRVIHQRQLPECYSSRQNGIKKGYADDRPHRKRRIIVGNGRCLDFRSKYGYPTYSGNPSGGRTYIMRIGRGDTLPWRRGRGRPAGLRIGGPL
jgi:hypothetical protein